MRSKGEGGEKGVWGWGGCVCGGWVGGGGVGVGGGLCKFQPMTL